MLQFEPEDVSELSDDFDELSKLTLRELEEIRLAKEPKTFNSFKLISGTSVSVLR